MKISTYQETILLIKAWNAGELKKMLRQKKIEYPAAMMRISRFRKNYPEEYAKICQW